MWDWREGNFIKHKFSLRALLVNRSIHVVCKVKLVDVKDTAPRNTSTLSLRVPVATWPPRRPMVIPPSLTPKQSVHHGTSGVHDELLGLVEQQGVQCARALRFLV